MKMPAGGFYSSLRSLALLVLAAITPLVVLATLLIPSNQRAEQQRLDEQLRRAAGRAAIAIERELYTQEQLLAMLAESPRLDPPIDTASFSDIVERLRVRLPDWSSVRVSDPAGHLLFVSPPPAVATHTVIDLASHQKVVDDLDPQVGEMVTGPAGKPGFALRVPIIRDGKLVYVLSAVIRPSSLEHTLDNTALQPGWEARLVDGAGQAIAGGPTAISASAVALEDAGYRTDKVAIEGTSWHAVVGMPVAAYNASERLDFWIVLASGIIAVAFSLLAAVLLRRELAYRRHQSEIVASSHRFDALSKLAGGLAHDFNNLLMGIQAGLDQLERRRTDEARFAQVVGLMRESLERAKSSVQRLSGFTRRSDTGSEVLRLQDRYADLAALIAQTMRDDIVLERDLDPRVWPIKVDPQALEIALVNLASNAQDAMPRGGKLKFSVKNVERAERLAQGVRGRHVHIMLADTGRGIEAEHMARIFDPFFTTKGATSSGLGLSQVYSFVRRFGGTAFAASVPGAGTAIHLLLPAVETETPAVPIVRRPARGQRVLVVDDDPIVAHGVAAFLEGTVAHVDMAHSGAEGLERLKAQSFDTLVTDITMPGMSGFEFARRAAELRPDLSIVLMTGYSDQLEKGAASQFRVLAKPFVRETLLEAIANRVVDEGNVVSLDRHR
ncbi:response regulator [Devosia soli]|uniref:response regulator n=1 Tax=Devosia soli TaxID=361041 RepID=UPI00069A9B07|nr:response regulator [Devosia soli]